MQNSRQLLVTLQHQIRVGPDIAEARIGSEKLWWPVIAPAEPPTHPPATCAADRLQHERSTGTQRQAPCVFPQRHLAW